MVSTSVSSAGLGSCAGVSVADESVGAATAGSTCGAIVGTCCGCAGTSDMVDSTASSAISVGTSCVPVTGITSSCAIVRLVSASCTAACPQPVSSRVMQMVSSMILFIVMYSFHFGSKHNYHTTSDKSTERCQTKNLIHLRGLNVIQQFTDLCYQHFGRVCSPRDTAEQEINGDAQFGG